MKEAIQIMNEIKELESRLVRLKSELLEFQEKCKHAYISDSLMSTCSYCMKSESHYY